MIRHYGEISIENKPSPFDGTGNITVRNLLEGPDEMYQKGRVFAHTTIYPGCGIGVHKHENESETYYILQGTGRYNDNGTIVDVKPGDVLFCGNGECHSIEASEEAIEMIALILYKEKPAVIKS